MPGERAPQRFAPVVRRDPAALLPAHLVGVRIGVRGEHHLLRHVLQPLAQHARQRCGREQQRLRREIQIRIRLLQQRRDLPRERPAAMHHHELRLAQRRIVQHRFEVQRIGARHVEVPARARLVCRWTAIPSRPHSAAT